MNSAELKRAKKAARALVLARRDSATAQERAEWGGAVARHLAELPEIRAAGTVMAFWSFGSELPTRMVIDALISAGKTVGLPRIVEGDLEVRSWSPGEALTETSFGALEPSGGRVLVPGDIDVVLTPAVAFDRSGRRVGYGGGFYDRFFPKTRAVRIGVGFALQVLDDPLPAGAFDLPVQLIVTEAGVIRPQPST